MINDQNLYWTNSYNNNNKHESKIIHRTQGMKHFPGTRECHECCFNETYLINPKCQTEKTIKLYFTHRY